MIKHFHISFLNANHWPYIFADFHYFHLLIFINWIQNAMWHQKIEPRGWKYYNTSQESYMSRSSFYKVKSCWILREGQTLANFFYMCCHDSKNVMVWSLYSYFFLWKIFWKAKYYYGPARCDYFATLKYKCLQPYCLQQFIKLISSEKLFGNFSGDCPHLTRSANSL